MAIIGFLLREPQLLFRPFTAADHDILWNILEPAVRAGETFAMPRDMDQAAAIDFWANGKHCFIAERDGEPVGSFFIKPNQLGGGSHVANAGYVTKPEARGQGVARAMCERSIELAAEMGFKAMQFNFVVSSNLSAVTLWQRCGFEIVGTLPEAFEHPRLGYVDALVMVRKL